MGIRSHLFGWFDIGVKNYFLRWLDCVSVGSHIFKQSNYVGFKNYYLSSSTMFMLGATLLGSSNMLMSGA